MEDKKHIVISVGGSLIVPNDIDTVFLGSFVNMIREYAARGFRFVLITGGGSICRQYDRAAEEITHPAKDDLDRIGIAVTRLNAEFLRVLFGELAYKDIILDPDMIAPTDKGVSIGGGWKPGNSSDLAAVHAAATVGAGTVINLSNIDYVYDKDPNKFSDAIKIERSSWVDFRKILPTEWQPGLHAPFDPIAAAKAEALGIEVAILNGKNIDNLKKYLDGDAFIGSVIK